MIAQQLAPDAAQRFLSRRDLRDDLWAVAILFHHSLQPANLSLDSAQAAKIRRLDRRLDTMCVMWRACVLHDKVAPRRRRLLETTLTELSAMAALARIGLSSTP